MAPHKSSNFTIEHKQLDTQEVIQVSTADKTTWFSVFPNYGGALHELVSHNQPLLETAHDEDSWIARTQNSFAGAQLCPFPNRTRNGKYTWQGEEYQLPTNDPAANNALHGLVYNKSFQEISFDAEKGILVLGLEYNNSSEGYPFPFHLENTYQLLENGISVQTKITNLASLEIPMGHGWHPYFSVGESVDNAHFQTSASAHFPAGEGYIPTEEEISYHEFRELEPIGKYVLDHCFKANQQTEKAKIYFPSKNITISVSSESYAYLQVYIPPHRNSIAIEPQSCIPNAFNNSIGLISLSPNESVEFDMALIIEHLS